MAAPAAAVARSNPVSPHAATPSNAPPSIVAPASLRAAEAVLHLKRDLIQSALTLLRSHTGYDMVPDSGKVVVFDSRLFVKDAFFGLQEVNMKGAPVWDSTARRYVGMITVTDFIDILRFYHADGKQMTSVSVAQAMDQQTIQDWAGMSPAATSHSLSVHRLIRVPLLFLVVCTSAEIKTGHVHQPSAVRVAGSAAAGCSQVDVRQARTSSVCSSRGSRKYCTLCSRFASTYPISFVRGNASVAPCSC